MALYVPLLSLLWQCQSMPKLHTCLCSVLALLSSLQVESKVCPTRHPKASNRQMQQLETHILSHAQPGDAGMFKYIHPFMPLLSP